MGVEILSILFCLSNYAEEERRGGGRAMQIRPPQTTHKTAESRERIVEKRL